MRVGADEAGKGPVLGPMVAAAVRADPAVLPDDVDDSKRVPEQRREEIARLLREREDVAVGVATVEPAAIDDPETDMNTLTVRAQVSALEAVANDGDEVVVDACDTSASRFGARVREGLVDRVDGQAGATDTAGSDAFDLLAEHAADETYPIVSAASVVAKVERDARIGEIAAEYGDVGSGYPSDPTTREFLAEYVAGHGDVPPCARRSWSTCEELLAANEQSALGDF